jgi:hypothetical protein
LNLRLLLADEVAQDYPLPDGKWDDEFKTRHHAANNPFSQQMISPAHRERWLSAAQDKLVRTFRANLDEDLHVQGYAGIGKSHLIGALTECLDPAKPCCWHARRKNSRRCASAWALPVTANPASPLKRSRAG